MAADLEPSVLLVPARDPIAEVLDDLAALSEHWTRLRAAGRPATYVRSAMILAAREIAVLASQEWQT